MAKQLYGTRKKYHFIYKTTNLLSGRYYIGMHSTDDLNDGYIGSGKRLKASIRKHGMENHKFEILEFFNSREELASKESQLVTMKEVMNKECMNLKIGGIGGFPPTAKQRFLESMKNADFKKMFGQKCSERNKKQYLEGTRKPSLLSWTGKKHKPESIQKMKKVKEGHGKGETNSQFGTIWITDGFKNRKIKKEDSIPEGWYSRKYKNVDLFWVTNEIENKRLKSSLPIPEGWRRGRKK